MQDSSNREYQITEYLVIEREIGEHTGNIQINLQQVVSNIVIIINYEANIEPAEVGCG
jgi:hypothetical protein